MDLQWNEYLVGAALAVGGSIAGWWGRGRRHGTERRTLDELYSRKVRLAESDREKAVRMLNQNMIEMRSHQERFDGHMAEIARLERELQDAQNKLSAARKDLKLRETELEDSRAEAHTVRTEGEQARIERTEAVAMRGKLAMELDRAKSAMSTSGASVVELRGKLEESTAKIDALQTQVDGTEATFQGERDVHTTTAADLERTSGELGTARREIDELTERLLEVDRLRHALAEREASLAERSERVVELEERVDELSPYPELLRQSEAQLAEADEHQKTAVRDTAASWDERHRKAIGERQEEIQYLEANVTARDTALDERDARIGELEQRVAELSPFPQRLSENEARLAEREKEWLEQEKALNDTWEDRHRDALGAKDSERGRLDEVIGERERTLDEKNERILELEKRIVELSPLPERLQEKEAAIVERTKDAKERHRDLNEAWKERHREALAEREAQKKELAARIGLLEKARRDEERQHGKARDELAARDRKIERLSTRLEELAPVPADLDQALARERALEEKLASTNKTADAAATRIETLKKGDDTKRKELVERKTHLASLSSNHKSLQLKVDRLQKQIDDLEAGLDRSEAELKEARAVYRDRGTTIKGLEAELKRLYGGKSPKQKAPRDDLKLIPGVGPVLEKKLFRHGVNTYAQLVSMEKDALEKLAEKVGTTVQRVRKDRWIAAAKKQHKAKYDEKL